MRLFKKFTICVAAGAICLCNMQTASAQDSDDLHSAYKKEFAYLESQKRALEKRLEKLDEKKKEQLADTQSELDELQGRLVSLRAKADRLEEKVTEAERNQQRASGADVVETTVSQANTTLGKHGLKVAVPKSAENDGDATVEDHAAAVRNLFANSTALMDRHSRVRTEQGEFFLANGTKAKGTVLKVGNIAAYGASDDAAGALAPAGEGRLKLWKKDAGDTARALIAGESPEMIDVFLFESLDKPVEEQDEKTWTEVVNSGGVIAWVIVALGALGLLLVLARAMILALAGANSRRLLEKVSDLVRRDEAERAREACKSARGSASRVLGAALDNLDAGREDLEDVVNESILHELPTLERFGSTILVFAAVAPLLGLLGTVTGMISTFDIITEFGTGDPKLLSGGISEALVTTQLGLIVAIPLLLVGNLLKGWSNSIVTQLERGALRLMNLANLDGADNSTKSDEENSSDKPAQSEDGSVEVNDATDYLGAV